MSFFKQKVITLVQMVPKGRVVTYGQVALYAGSPNLARQVGGILKQNEENLPWWRVVNREGRITIKGTKYADKFLQANLLRSEGVFVSPDFLVSLPKYRFALDPA